MKKDRREYQKQYVKKHHSRILEIKLNYRIKNRERIRKKQEEYMSRMAKGSMKDMSWDKELKLHTCCNSKRANLHRIKCPLNSDDLSDLKDI